MIRTICRYPLRTFLAGAVVLSLLPALIADAAERRASGSRRAAKPVPESVEFFDAMKSGKIEVQFVPRDSTEATVRIKNKTKRPLSVKLPDAFAATPVLAQMGGMGGGGMGGMGGGGMGGGGGGGQGMGGGMGGGGMGGGGMGGGGMGGGGMGGGGGGFFNVAAEKVGRFKVACVCLEHGKKEPRAAIPYEIKPLDSFSTNPQLAALMTMFGRGGFDQRAVQAAAWHLANGMSWQQLADKDNGPDERYFSPQEVRMAYEIVSAAERMAAENPEPAKTEKSPGERDTSSVR